MYGVPNAYGGAYGGPAAYLNQEFADSVGLHESKRNGSSFPQPQSRGGYVRYDGRDGGPYASGGQTPQRQGQPPSYAPPLRLPLPSPNDERMSGQGNPGPPPFRQMSNSWQKMPPEYGYQEPYGYRDRDGDRATQYYGQMGPDTYGMEQPHSSHGGISGAGQRERAQQMGRYQRNMEDPRYRDQRSMEASWHSYGMPAQDHGMEEWQGGPERLDYGERIDRRNYGEMRDQRGYQEQREQRAMENMGYDPRKKSDSYTYNITTVADPGSGSGVTAANGSGGDGGVGRDISPKIAKGDDASVRSGSGPSHHSDRSGSDGETESVKTEGAEEGAGKGLGSMSTELPGWSRRSQLIEAMSTSTGRDLGAVQEALEACSWDRERAAMLLLRNDSNMSNVAYQEYGVQLNSSATDDLDPQGFVAATPTTGPTPVGTPRLQPAQSPGGTVQDRERQGDSLFNFDYTLPHAAVPNSMFVDPFNRPGMWGGEGASFHRQDSEGSKDSEDLPSRRGSAAVVRTLTPGPDSSAVALSTGRALSWSDVLSADASGRRPAMALEQLEKSYVEAARAHPTQELNRRYMTTFRIRLCPISNCKDTPNRRCFNAHNPKHARRLPAGFKVPGSGIQYVYYPKRCLSMWLHGVCEEGVRCQYAHSTDEILYHPLVFRTQRCDFWGEPLPCPRMGPHCPKAHNPNELRSAADVPPELFVDPASLGKAAELKFRHTFDVRTYKTMPCLKQKSKTREPKAKAAAKAKRCTDRVSCDGYHDAKERRRHPDYFNYSSEPCPAVYDRDLATWGYPSACEKGDHCPLAHSLMEVMYHRDKYKTKPCERWGKPPLQCSWGERCAYKHGEQDNGYTPPKLPLRPATAIGSAQQMPHPSAPGTDMALAYALGVHQQNQQLMEYAGQANQMRTSSDTQSVATSASGRDTPTDLQKRLDDAEQQVAQLMTEHEWLEQSLECPVCRELGSRDRALPCGHVVCHTCLGVQANAQPREYEMFAPTLACPVCQKVHPINSVYKIIL
eukprot:comp24016_c0_seq1/m.42899 comp24016_c0_seq1/g.42899  ORF comp24016_c0_seq1/g.42899 comp24016_c0_seq1/m.42899 type:complete len:1012 (-) comp24016_c0_seq1:829-3864(-)